MVLVTTDYSCFLAGGEDSVIEYDFVYQLQFNPTSAFLFRIKNLSIFAREMSKWIYQFMPIFLRRFLKILLITVKMKSLQHPVNIFKIMMNS